MNPLLAYRPKSDSTNIGGYRYFFNGQESDNEVFGELTLHAFEFRMHDARLGRFWSVDPLAVKYLKGEGLFSEIVIWHPFGYDPSQWKE